MMSDSVIGEEVDGYRIQELLGRGGMGVVYKAEEIALSRPVALKCLNSQLAGDESFLSRFRSEARAIARVNSPYIVQVYTLSETEIGLIIVMEYVEGGTLKQWINEDETNWKRSLPLIQQMLTALEHAHNAGVIHRDVKPQNILLSDIVQDPDIRIKMTDFGLAKVNSTGDPRRTVTQAVYGTLPYMSPEQVEGHGQIDHRTDIYSIGMTCYEMLAGRLPFNQESLEYEIMRTIVEEDLPGLSTFAPEVPDKLRDIVMRALVKNPEDRFQSASEMQDALGELQESRDPDHEPITVPANLTPLEEEKLTQKVPTENRGETKKSLLASTRTLVFKWSWQVASLGTLLAVLLVGALYLSVFPPASYTGPTNVGERSTPNGKTSSEGVAFEKSDSDVPGEGTIGKTPHSETTNGNTPDEITASIDSTPKESLGEGPTGEVSTGASAQDEDLLGEQDSNNASEQSAADQTNEGTTGKWAPGTGDNTNAVDTEASGVDPGTPGTGGSQRGALQDLSSPIPALLEVDDPSVLSRRIDQQVAKGELIRGEGPGDFFTPGQCYIFIVDPKASRIEAVLGPKTDGVRVELRSGRRVDNWDSRYSDSFQIWTALTSD